MKLTLPAGVTVILAAVAAIAVAFVQSNIIVLEPGWNEGVTIGLTILALWGISPLTHTALIAVLHLSNGTITAIGGALGTLQIVLTQVHMSAGLHGVLAGIIAFAAGLGFAPAIEPIQAALARQRA